MRRCGPGAEVVMFVDAKTTQHTLQSAQGLSRRARLPVKTAVLVKRNGAGPGLMEKRGSGVGGRRRRRMKDDTNNLTGNADARTVIKMTLLSVGRFLDRFRFGQEFREVATSC